MLDVRLDEQGLDDPVMEPHDIPESWIGLDGVRASACMGLLIPFKHVRKR